MSKLWRRLAFLLFRRRFNRDLEDEMRFHLEMKTRAGGETTEAGYSARRQFGNVTLFREESREQWGWVWLETLLQDLRYGVRMLVNNPSFTLIAVLTLAVGIGVNTAIFTAFNAVALRPLDVPEPERVVQVTRSTSPHQHFSYPDYVYYRDNNQVFSDLATINFEGVSLTGVSTPPPARGGGIAGAAGFRFAQVTGGGGEVAQSALVSGDYFKMLGVDAAVGRTFGPQEDNLSAPAVALMSYNFWERRFGKDPGLLGHNLNLNGIAFTVVGITRRDFLCTAPTVPDFWLPMTSLVRLDPDAKDLSDRAGVCCRVYGRLRPGVEAGQAEAQMNTLASQLRREFPESENQTGAPPNRIELERGSPFGAPNAGFMAIAALVLAAVSSVLLIACSNVASLLLARSAARQKEIAVRLAIGATRGRLIRQLLTECALISLFAGGIGLLFAWWSLRFLVVQVVASMPTYWGTMAFHLTPDHRVFAYLLLLSVVAIVAFGLAPALAASRADVTPALKKEGTVLGHRMRGSRLRDVLVIGQVGVCLALLVTAGLLARGSQRAFSVDLGFDYHNIVSIDVGAPEGMKLTPASRVAIHRRLLERLEAMPGVESVTAGRMPLAGGVRTISVSPAGHLVTGRDAQDAVYNRIASNYFNTMKIPIVRGHGFAAQEARDDLNFDASPVIVSEATARRFWPGQDPIGKRISFGFGPDSSHWAGEEYPHSSSSTVIGVAGDVRSVSLEEFDETCLYLPMSRTSGGFVIRTRGNENAVSTAVIREVRAIDNSLRVVIQNSQTAFTNQSAFVVSRVGAIGSAIIGILGLLMASVGIYGMVSFAVSQRTHEIGVRIALGAGREDVLKLVLGESMRPVLIGVVIGILAAAGAARVLVSLLFGLSSFDPPTFLGVSAILAAVALLAGYIPARRAMKVDPMVALRYE